MINCLICKRKIQSKDNLCYQAYFHYLRVFHRTCVNNSNDPKDLFFGGRFFMRNAAPQTIKAQKMLLSDFSEKDLDFIKKVAYIAIFAGIFIMGVEFYNVYKSFNNIIITLILLLIFGSPMIIFVFYQSLMTLKKIKQMKSLR